MNTRDVPLPQQTSLAGVLAALKRSARAARETAVRTETSVVVYRTAVGIVEITAAELRAAGYK